MRKTFSLIILSFTILNVYSQNPKPNEVAPVAQSWSFSKYGGANVNLYTGTINIDVPMYTYKDPDFEIPISLGYASNGYKPNIQTGILGLGWYLNAGGIITRGIRGIADNYYGEGYFKMQNKRIVKGEYYKYSTNNVSFKQDGTNVFYDTQPDVFHFNFMGHTGYFVFLAKLDNNNMVSFDVKIYNTSHPKGQYSVEVINPNIMINCEGFIITTGDGYKYYFNASERINATDYPRMSWSLTKIQAPNGREVIFNYDFCEPNDPSPNSSKYKVSTYLSALSEFSASNCTSPGLNYQTIWNPQTIFTIYLKDIVVNGNVIARFSYSDKKPEHCHVSPFRSELYQLSQISYGNNQECRFNYKSSRYLNDKFNSLTFLNSLQFSDDSEYKFEYLGCTQYNNAGEIIQDFPEISTWQLDFWGYWNGRGTQSGFLPYTSGTQPLDELILDNSRDADSYYSSLGMLSKIIYPTKGYSIFTYGANKYRRYLKKDSSSDFLPTKRDDKSVDMETAGIRLESVIDYDYDGAQFNQTTYEYKREDNTSSGILLKYPRYRVVYSLNSGLTYQLTNGFSPIPNTMDKTHIEYSRVREIHNDGSSIIHYFSDYPTVPDFTNHEYTLVYSSSDRKPTDHSRNLMAESNSMHNYRGRLINKIYLDKDNDTISSEKHIYNWAEPSEAFAEPTIAGGSTYYHKIYRGDIPLDHSIYTSYFDNKQIRKEVRYKYNTLSQLIETVTSTSSDSKIVEKTQYVSDINNPIGIFSTIKAKHLWNYPLMQQTTRQLGSNSYLLYGAKYDYSSSNGIINISLINKVDLQSPIEITSDFSFHDYLKADKKYQYNYYGRVAEETDNNNVKTVYIWDDTYQYLMAIIKNCSMNDVYYANIITEDDGSITLDETQMSELYSIDGVEVTYYAYKPLAGLTKKIDPSKKTTYYIYDKNHKLIAIVDDKGNLVESYGYNYKN